MNAKQEKLTLILGICHNKKKKVFLVSHVLNVIFMHFFDQSILESQVTHDT